MVEKSQIKWASYSIYEGPFFHGTAKFELPPTPTESDRIMAVITATEGGRWNAINMYDKCICTVGLIQWCEGGQYSVSDMLGATVGRSEHLLDPIRPMLEASAAEFKRNSRGRWRFHFKDDRGEVDRTVEQQRLFLACDGRKGSWDDFARDHAKGWAAALSSVYEQPAAIAAQRDFTVPKLKLFALPFARAFVDTAPGTPVGRAFVAAFLSFAANNPKWAATSLQNAVEENRTTDYMSIGWLVTVLRHLTFDPQIAIYPQRYNAIRPVLERLYGINLPDFAAELSSAGGDSWLSTEQIQGLLVDLGYNIGPSGVDGRWGPKSQAALAAFQAKFGLEADGWPDPATNEKLLRALEGVAELKDAHGGVIPPELRARAEALVTMSMDEAARSYFDSRSRS